MAKKKPSIEELTAKAEGGDLDSTLRLGHEYWIGLIVDQDLNQSLHWYELAKVQGYAEADSYIDFINHEIYWASRTPLMYKSKMEIRKRMYDESLSPYDKALAFYSNGYNYEALELFQSVERNGNKDALYWIAEIKLKNAKSDNEYEEIVKLLFGAYEFSNTTRHLAYKRLEELANKESTIGIKASYEILSKLYSNRSYAPKTRLKLAHYYYAGLGTKVDKQKALDLYRAEMPNMRDNLAPQYYYEYGKLEIELSGLDQLQYANGVYHLVKAMEQHSKEAAIEVEHLLLSHDPYALIYVIGLYKDSPKRGNPKKAVKYINEYFAYCKYDQCEMPSCMSDLAEFYIKGLGVVQSFILAYFWLALSMSLVDREYYSDTKLMNKLMQLLDPKDVCALQKIVKEAHSYIINLPEDKPLGDLEAKFMSNIVDAVDYDKLTNSNINLSIELAELKNARDSSLDKAVSFHSYFHANKFDVKKVSIRLCLKDPALGDKDHRTDMLSIEDSDLIGFFVFYEDQKDYKNFRVFSERISRKIRNFLLKLAYYSTGYRDQMAELLPQKVDEPMSRLNTMFKELFKPYLDKVRTPFIDLDGFRIEVSLDHPEYIDPGKPSDL